MKLRVPASRDVRRVLESLLFWLGLIAFATAPYWILQSGLAAAFNDLAFFLFPPGLYR